MKGGCPIRPGTVTQVTGKKAQTEVIYIRAKFSRSASRATSDTAIHRPFGGASLASTNCRGSLFRCADCDASQRRGREYFHLSPNLCCDLGHSFSPVLGASFQTGGSNAGDDDGSASHWILHGDCDRLFGVPAIHRSTRRSSKHR